MEARSTPLRGARRGTAKSSSIWCRVSSLTSLPLYALCKRNFWKPFAMPYSARPCTIYGSKQRVRMVHEVRPTASSSPHLAPFVREVEKKEGCQPFRTESCGRVERLNSNIFTVSVPQIITKEPLGSSWASFEASRASVVHASKPCLRLHCRSSDLVRTSTLDASAPVLNETVRLVVTDLPCNVRRLRKCKSSAPDNLSVKDMKNTFGLTANVLRPGGYATPFRTAQHFAVWDTLFFFESSRRMSACLRHMLRHQRVRLWWVLLH